MSGIKQPAPQTTMGGTDAFAHALERDVVHVNASSDNAIITPFDTTEKPHTPAFISLLREQALVHDVDLPIAQASMVARNIGRDFKTTLLCIGTNGKKDSVKGMVTTTEAATAEGKFLFLEDLVVTEGSRRMGYGTDLFNHQLLTAWNQDFDGLAWETGRNNEAACKLYASIDSVFNPTTLLDAWELPKDQWALLSRTPNHHARLLVANSTDRPLNKIAVTLTSQPHKNLDFLSEVLREAVANRRPKNYIVAIENGSFALVSEGYSTFEGCVRADARLYLSRHYTSPHHFSYSRSDVQDLAHGVSIEMGKRNISGSMHLEIANNLMDEDPDKAAVLSQKLQSAAEGLRAIPVGLQGVAAGRPLIHNGPMVGYWLSGQRFVSSVVNAAKNMPDFKLLPERKALLAAQAAIYSLTL